MFSARIQLRRVTIGLAVAMMLLLGAYPATSQGGGAVRLPGLSGGALTEEALSSGASIIVIWASWSPRSRDIVARVNALEKSWGAKASVVTVNFQEERAAIEQFLAGKSLAVPVFLDRDGAFAKRNAVTTLPGLLIYKDGEVAYGGKLPNDADALIGRILG